HSSSISTSMFSNEKQKQLFDLSKKLINEAVATSELLASDQVNALTEVVQYHEWRYSVLNDPVISDFEYDTLYKKLEALETAFPALLSPDSPTQRVANDLTEDAASIAHLTPMLSLDNSYNAEDLKDFDERIKKLTGIAEDQPIEYVVEPKFDGGSIALVYENNRLVRGATRGNGKLGEEMTANARAMKSIPLRADFSKYGIQKTELRGEVLIRKDVFEKINQQRAKDGLTLFANPRNAATGGLRMKSAKESSGRGLEAFIYQLGFAENAEGTDILDQFETHDESIQLLSDLGFKVPTVERKVCKNIQEVADFCLEWQERRETYPYEIDGMVVKVNSRALQEQCGYTSHHPRWAIAFKFKAKQATTKLLNVEYQVGKIGSITPVAKLDPVHLAGVTVSSVSLHNEEFITSKDLRLGDTVLVERAGDVIPYIVKAMEDLRDGSEIPIEYPRYCPINTTDKPIELIQVEGEAAWRCPACVCGKQELQKMIFHVSKPAMDIDGFGKSYVERFNELGWVKNIADIYRLDYEQIATLDGFGKKSAQNIEKAIAKAKQNPISRLLHSLSIHHLGKKASKLVAQRIDHVLDLQNWTEETFVDIKDIGPVVAKNVIAYFSNPDNIALLKEMESLGVNLRQTEEDKPLKIAEDAPLAGKTILFTGSLQTMGRKQAQEIATKEGAKVISAVSSKLNILVVGEKAGSKLKKAQALGTVEIITEAAFRELVNI
ncbi:MAG: NAD-dependent DNA ligase LigA, partial [Bacteroidota bacterium]